MIFMTRMLWLSKKCPSRSVKKKIRGGKRILQIICNWKESATMPLDLNRLHQYHYCYERVVHPWVVYVGSRISPPKRFRNEIILGLLRRYEHWNTQLQMLGEPYYLKVWLFDKTFFESQIVVGIQERIQRYENVFHQVERKLVFPFQHFANNAAGCLGFQWTPGFENGNPDDDEYPRRNLVWIGGVNND